MSLHRYVVPPPLALAVHPAPPPKPAAKKDEKTDDKKDDPKAKQDEGKKGAKLADKKENGLIVDVNGKENKKKDGGPAKAPGESPNNADPDEAPPTPTSMVPEPPTPATDQGHTKGDQQQDPKDATYAGKAKSAVAAKDKVDEVAPAAEPEPDPEPIRLLPPVPHRPVRTRIDLNPAGIYPPIITDPRGAYHKYSKHLQGETVYIDVTKDGWLVEQWRERSEREALARLRGEAERDLEREMEADRQRRTIRRVPRSAEQILLELWNDLTQSVSHELPVEYFWSRYDWADPTSHIHLEDISRPVPEEPSKDTQGTDDKGTPHTGKDDGEKEPTNKHAADIKLAHSIEKQPLSAPKLAVLDERGNEVEWTKEGLELILATVGVQCAYNTPKPIPRQRADNYNTADPASGYLLLTHGFFCLRHNDALDWKPEESAGKFEVLVTSGHDRVFGDMVKAKAAEEKKKKEIEYRKRKLAEKLKAEEEAKKNGSQVKGTGKEGENDGGDKEPGKDVDGQAAMPMGKVKEKDGQVRRPSSPTVAPTGKQGKTSAPVPVDPTPLKEKKDEDAQQKKQKLDEKHEKDGVPVALKVDGHNAERPKVGEKKAVAKDKNKPNDQMRDAELLAQMLHAAGPNPKDPVPIADIKMAYKALEMADASSLLKGGAAAKKEEPKGPLIWAWYDRCEKWRWRNFEAGLHEVGPGGWEERDWVVFADDRGCDEFYAEQSILETEEQNVFDWNC